MIPFRRKSRRPDFGLNTTSTADISFVLLIFFLVTTSMDTSKGLSRQLPPYNPDQRAEQRNVEREKVLTIHLMKEGKLTVESLLEATAGQSAATTAEPSAYAFPMARADEARLRKQLKDFIATVGPTHIIEIQTDREADYDSYFRLQNAIVRSYRELRDAYSMKIAGCPFAQCPESKRQKVLDFYPQRITETTRKND